MPVHNTANEGKAAMFDSTDGHAFGPVFDSEGELDDFVEFAAVVEPRDLRRLSAHELNELVTRWRGAIAANEREGAHA